MRDPLPTLLLRRHRWSATSPRDGRARIGAATPGFGYEHGRHADLDVGRALPGNDGRPAADCEPSRTCRWSKPTLAPAPHQDRPVWRGRAARRLHTATAKPRSGLESLRAHGG